MAWVAVGSGGLVAVGWSVAVGSPGEVGFGVAVGALMTAAFVYIALKLGFSMPGSTVAAILGFAILRGVLGEPTRYPDDRIQVYAVPPVEFAAAE